jgi:iron complex outermembrane recepter protein
VGIFTISSRYFACSSLGTLASLFTAPAAHAGTAPTPSDPPSIATDAGDRDTTLIVTGIRGGKPRTVADSPAPIDVIHGDQITGVGRSDVAESLAHLLPSINFGSTQAGVNSIVRPIFNRGLGPAYTLVLVNGKRRHNGALLTNGGGDTSGVNPVDLDQLPLSSITDIEVLKDSAAAQYGSDAVAGVINIELKKQDHGLHAEVLGGSLYDGQGNLQTFKAAVDAGFRLGTGFIHVSADVRDRGLTWQNFFATQLPYPTGNAKNAQWNGDGAHNGDPGIKSYSLGYNAEVPLSDAVTAYSYATFGQRSTVIGNNFRRPDSTADFSSVFPNGYYPLNNTAEVDFQVLAGLKGNLGQTHWDLSTTYGRDRVRQYSNLTINPSLGPTSPTSFDHLATYQFEQYVTDLDVTRGIDVGLPEPIQVSAGLEWRVDRFQDFAGDPLAYTNGGYVIQAGDQEGDPNVGSLAAIGAQAAVTLSPADVVRLTRNDVAGYLDIGVTPLRNWYVGSAVRVEHYDDSSGTTAGYKFNSRYDVTPWLAVRGTAGTGFRAPSLTQIGYAQTDNRTGTNPITGAFGPSYTKLARTDSPLAIALGAQPLKPEKSTNFGLGLVLRPAPRLDITIDGYQIAIKHRIIRTGTLLGPDLANILAANGLNAATWVTYFANAVDTRTRGLDAVADYRFDLGSWGRLNLDASFNYNHTTVTNIANAPPALAALQALGNAKDSLVFVQRANIGDLTVNLPQTKLILGGRWTRGRLWTDLQLTRYGSYHYIRDQIPADDRVYGAKWLTDLEVGYDLHHGAKISVGASNLFNVHPDRRNTPDAATGSAVLVYGPAPFSLAGGFYFGKLSFDL